MKKYVVCLPINRTPNSETKWDDYVKKWKQIRNIEFEYWGDSEIELKLSREQHGGLHKYFFDEEFLTNDWFDRRRQIAIKDAGPRYSKQLNVNLPIAQLFDILGRTDKFYDTMKLISQRISIDWEYIVSSQVISLAEPEFDKLRHKIEHIVRVLRTVEELEQDKIDFKEISEECSQAGELTKQILEKLQNTESSFAENISPNHIRERFNIETHHLRMTHGNLSELANKILDEKYQMTNNGAMLLVGDAGTGKTHLFCDVLNQWVDTGKACVLLHGIQFERGNPRDAILKNLDLRYTFEQFLGAMNAAGQAVGTRALIMIDALNEGDGQQVWYDYMPGFLEEVSKYPWVAIALSVRTTYEQAIIPNDLQSEKISKFVHNGFGGNVEEALKVLFDANNITRPSIPMLGEFANPQFLIVMCRGLKNMNKKEIPGEPRSLMAVYNLFLNSVEEKLSKKLGYLPHRRIVHKAVNTLVQHMLSDNLSFLRYEDANRVLSQIHGSSSDFNSLLSNLISEGVLSQELLNFRNKPSEPIIRFAYERLADNLIIQTLLERIRDRTPFMLSDEPMLAQYIADPTRHGGKIEAMSIQLPELLHKELLELSPDLGRSSMVVRSFLDSFMWRSSDSVGEYALTHVKMCLEKGIDLGAIFRTLITISTDLENPLNGKFLHEFLLSLDMGTRDSAWSTFLHSNYCLENGIIDRYIDWSWNIDKSSITSETAFLSCMTLAWFLTSTDRRIRDRATKAMVSMLSVHMSVLMRILPKFKNCNDPYVTERLYCVAYGCAMRCEDMAHLRELAAYTYNVIFRDGMPPPNIMLRDYARGIIEYALYKNTGLEIDVKKITPPYNSEWISDFPTKKEVGLELSSTGAQHSRGKRQILYSLSPHGDFYRYVLGGNTGSFEWCNVRLLTGKKSRKQSAIEFEHTIDNSQKALWHKFCSGILNEKKFNQKLNPSQKTLFKDIVPYLNCLRNRKQDDNLFDLQSLARWIAKRVLDLGWTDDRFGQYDDYTARYTPNSVSGRVERMGKKYQWIAYYELLARISDNFEFRGAFGHEGFRPYEGPWQINLRNIDPSFLSTKTPNKHAIAQSSDKLELLYDGWDSENDDVQWIKNEQDLPSFKSSLEIVGQDGNSKWIVLNAQIYADQPRSEEQRIESRSRRNISISIESCLVKKSDTQKLYNWYMRNHLRGSTPEHDFTYSAFLGELYWSKASQRTVQHWDPNWIKLENSDRPPISVYVSTYEYHHEMSEYDGSIDDNIQILLPNRILAEKMNLRNKSDGSFTDSKGDVIVHSINTCGGHTRILVVRKDPFVKFLDENNYGIIWDVMGEKMVLEDRIGSWKGRLAIKGVYKMVNEKIRGKSKTKFANDV